MVNPGAFQGMRHVFLQSQKSAYAHAVLQDMAADRIADIQRMFFKRFPLDLDESEEPSDETMAAVDDDAPDPEPLAPNEDLLSPEAFVLAVKAFQARTDLVTFRRAVSVHDFYHKQHQTYPRAANQTLVCLPTWQGSPVFQTRIYRQGPFHPSHS